MNNEWQEQRDRRTDSCTNVNDGYKHAVVQVIVTENMQEYRVQLMIHFSLLMLAKWCRNITVSFLDADSLIPGRPGSFKDLISQEIQAADPSCQLNFEEAPVKASITLFIGEPPADYPDDFVSINGAGFLTCAAFNKASGLPMISGQQHLPGACFAACLANAELFRYMVGLRSKPYVKWYSLWSNEVCEGIPPDDTGPLIGAIELGRVHLVGCGSIGSSFVYLMPYLNVIGQWLLVDPDDVEDHNTSSSLLFTYDAARNNHKKVQLCKEYLSMYGIRSELFEDFYSKYPYSHNELDLKAADIMLCFANEHNIWSTIQHLYPPVCFHATTSKSWGVHIGRHIPLVENCLMCTFEQATATKFVPICAEGAIPGAATTQEKNTEESHTAILPFLAPAAALVTLTEIIKAIYSSAPPHDNTTEFNLGTSNGTFLTTHQPFGSCYVCRDQGNLYKTFGPFGKHWDLSIS